MGLQFFMRLVSPFFGMSLIIAVLKNSGRLFLSRPKDAHSNSGYLKKSQNCDINLYEYPSTPGADRKFASLIAL
jgi:hypothetical protein